MICVKARAHTVSRVPHHQGLVGENCFLARVGRADTMTGKVLKEKNVEVVPKLLSRSVGPRDEPKMPHVSPTKQPTNDTCSTRDLNLGGEDYTQPTASDAFAVNLNSPQNDTPQPQPFRREVSAAARWWASQLQGSGISKTNLKTFEDTVATLLAHRCDGHWYPSDPSRASGLRSTMNDVTVDPILVAAAEAASIADIGRRLPLAVVWVNPGSVRARVEGAVPAFDVA